MVVKDFLITYWLDILIVLGGFVAIAYFYFNGQKDVVRKIVLDLVREAEDMLGAKTGELKYAYVVNEVYRRLPRVLTFFLTKKFLNELIEDGVYILKDYLDNGYLDQSYVIIEEIEEDSV